MKRDCVRLTVAVLLCLAAAVVLTACGGDDDVPDHVQPPDYATAGNYETEPDTAEQPVPSNVQTAQPILRRMWPVANPYAGGRAIPSGFRVEIARKDAVHLDFFDNLHEFDYTAVRDARSLSADSYQPHTSPYTLIIWSSQPMRDVTVVTLGSMLVNGASTHVAIDSFPIADELHVRDGLVISNYASLVTSGWSGISFVDEYGVRRYFSISYRLHAGDFRLWEFDSRGYLWPEGRPPWWAWAYDADDVRPYLHSWSSNWHNLESDFGAPCYERRAELLAQAGISEYGWRVAADFLRGFDSLFMTVGLPMTAWDADRSIGVPLGRYVNWFGAGGVLNTLYERPDIVFIGGHVYGYDTGFFDRDSNQITDVPWLTEWHFVNYFRLFDFDGSGIPDIIVHFMQTFEGCYGGFYQIFRYVDGEFAAIEMTAYFDGEPSRWLNFGSSHDLFLDETGRIITFTASALSGNEITHLVLTDDRAEFHHLLGEFCWYEWRKHHWHLMESTPYGSIFIDDWLNNSPTIFGTDIGITPLEPFYGLGAEMMRELRVARD